MNSKNLISGRQKDREQLLVDAVNDVSLAIYGLNKNHQNALFLKTQLESFVRVSSVFLRKVLIGDRNEVETRLLDESMINSLSIKFNPIRKIPKNQCREIYHKFRLKDLTLSLTRIDHLSRPTQVLTFGDQGVDLIVTWPLPGVADWHEAPTEEKPWVISPNQLFDMISPKSLTCTKWLGQQVFVFDGKPISLKNIITRIANFEGAHSISSPLGPKNIGKKEESRRHFETFNSIMLFDFPLSHIVIIETTLFIYEQLIKTNTFNNKNSYEYFRLTFPCNSEQALSSEPNWLAFQISMIFSFREVSHRYTLKPVK